MLVGLLLLSAFDVYREGRRGVELLRLCSSPRRRPLSYEMAIEEVQAPEMMHFDDKERRKKGEKRR